MTTKDTTVESIVQLNPSATPAFLEQFTPAELAGYLLRLQSIEDARVPYGALELDEQARCNEPHLV